MLKKICIFVLTITMLISISAYATDTFEGYDIPVDIDINGSFIKCIEKPILIDGTSYIPLRAFSDAIGGITEWNQPEMAATLTKDGHSFVFYTDKSYCLIDGEEKSFHSVLYRNLTFVPVRAISETLGYDVLWDDFYLTVKMIAPGVEVPENLKDASYTYDDILYLGKIIYVESGAQPFKGMLAIGGVVMNRVESSLFPGSIKEVIFDTKYGVQFPPAHTDIINVTPSWACMVAAKCALGGVKVVGNSLYFVSAKSASSSWVGRNRPYCTTIHGVAFYE